MVYNAMKLFMEINPQLFDDCSHDYNEQRDTAEEREKARQSKWDQLALQASQRHKSQPSTNNARVPKINTTTRIDEADPITQDSRERLDALRLQDESGSGRDQRRTERQKQVGTQTPSVQLILPLQPIRNKSFTVPSADQAILTAASVLRGPTCVKSSPEQRSPPHPASISAKLQHQRPQGQLVSKSIQLKSQGRGKDVG